MAPERYLLLGFFKDLIDLSIKFPGRTGWGCPCSYLLEKLLLYQDNFIKKITGDYTGDFHEFRLNGAGLKMNWRVVKTEHSSRFQCYIGGDQKKEYPAFVEAAETFIKKRGVNHR